jgi:hypothetical protein
MIILIYGEYVQEVLQDGDEIILKYLGEIKVTVIYGFNETICKWDKIINGGRRAIYDFAQEKVDLHEKCKSK